MSGGGCREGVSGNESRTLTIGVSSIDRRLKDTEEESTLRDRGRLFHRAGAEDLKERATKRFLLTSVNYHQESLEW